jgi:hypothetical protein
MHADEPMVWTARLNGCATPFGDRFISTVKDVAARIRIDITPITRSNLTPGADSNFPAYGRRTACSRASRRRGSLPPRLVVKQEEAVRATSDWRDYWAASVERAFHARFWNLERPHAIER